MRASRQMISTKSFLLCHASSGGYQNDAGYAIRVSPGKQCLSAMLKKVLSHDHVWFTKTTASFKENESIGCYDQLVK